MRAQPDWLSEHDEQAALFQWAMTIANARWPELELLFAIPNAGRMGGHKGRMWGGRLKKEGLRAGVPDLFLPVPRGSYHGLFLELKRVKHGSTSTIQTAWHTALRAQGYQVEVAKGAQAAIAILTVYLQLGS